MWIAIGVVALIVVWFVATYNSFVKSRALVDEAFSGMDVYLKKRYDLIPNLVETVKAYMTHEQDTLAKIVELRGKAAGAPDPQARMAAEGELSNTLTHLFALSENYPDLKANAQFLSLQNDLRGIEDEISQARKYYNGAAKQFNIKTQTIPSSLVAGICHFTPYAYFEIAQAERENVKVDFGK